MHFTADTTLSSVPPNLRGPFTRWQNFQKTPFEERFWSRVKIGSLDACWLFSGNPINSGYGVVRLPSPERKNQLAHRLAWIFSRGHIPDGVYVCHHCDVKMCCNPNHLFLGTPTDNQVDRCRKGRGNPTALTAYQIIEIRRRYSPRKVTIDKLAQEFAVSRSSIQRAIYKNDWVNPRQ